MSEKDFFNKQSALTSAKTKIYRNYIEGYLPKLLMTYQTCLIADLFCGAGKNGKEDGSPLILIDRLIYILSSPQLQEKNNLKVHVLFNDQNKENIENLKNELEKINYDKDIITIHLKHESYDTLLPEIISMYEQLKIPKFFFLDPFTYSNVKMEDLKKLMSLDYTEVLLFIPIFHTYRFSSAEFTEKHKTRIFIEEFTTKGVTDYVGIDDFLYSIREKLLQAISLKYIRPVLLDGGGSKNALFLLTKNQKGMLLMNQIAFKVTGDGTKFKVKEKGQASLFPINEVSSIYTEFIDKLINRLQIKNMTNKEIVDFSISECCLPIHAKKELKNLYDLKKIKIFDNNHDEIKDTRKWNIANEVKIVTVFKWQKNE